MKSFVDSPWGQAALAFLRVAVATLLGAWLQAGTPLQVTPDELVGWVEVALSAGVALVLSNYFGPWEDRYGYQKEVTRPEA